MKPNINVYEQSKKVFFAAMRSQYEIFRNGYIDFPTEDKWLQQEWMLFVENNPELLQLRKTSQGDYIHEYEGGLVRVII